MLLNIYAQCYIIVYRRRKTEGQKSKVVGGVKNASEYNRFT